MSTENKAKHGGNIYEAIRRFGGGYSDFLDFSANINPLGLSSKVRSALLDSMDLVTGYPDPDAVALKRSISECYRVPVEWIEAGNGAVELIYLLCRALAPARIMAPAPTFSEYSAAARAAGVPFETLPLDKETGFTPSITELSQKIQAGDLLFLCNPNNPTGVVLTRHQFEPLVEKASAVGAHIVFDESFNDFLSASEEKSCRTLIARHPCVIVLHSLTKFLAIPGLRLGFMLGRPDLVERMKRLRDPWNVNVMAQAAGTAGLADTEYRQDSVALIAREKEKIVGGLQSIPELQVFSPSVNFVLAELGESGWDAIKLQEALTPYRILIRNCENFEGLSSRYIRVAVKGPAENLRFLNALKKIMLGVDTQ